jgi:hypothetical protein
MGVLRSDSCPNKDGIRPYLACLLYSPLTSSGLFRGSGRRVQLFGLVVTTILSNLNCEHFSIPEIFFYSKNNFYIRDAGYSDKIK